MIRTIITPKNQNLTLNIPKNLIGKKLEVLVFSHNETKNIVAIENALKNDKIETHLASEQVLANEWLNEKEDLVWKDL
jgi:hypothetical protein